MGKITKWLSENGIQHETSAGCIRIYIKKGCVWVNGLGEDMVYDESITIYKDKYKNYIVTETIGYNRFSNLFKGTRADNAIKILAKRLGL